MSVIPRIAAFWSSLSTPVMSYFDRGDEEQAGLVAEAEGMEEAQQHIHDTRTPLDKTIDRIGMGSYQWTLLSLCGFGWLADNMWLQGVAIILPRVQRQFSVPDKYIGTLSASMFAGMMLGAVGWGACSDLMGRTTAFNATLLLTAAFGVLASVVDAFPTLCIALFLLGSAVGGSMPTDGTLLLEHMPNGKQHLVTALSVFFSFGSVLAAVVSLVVIPSRSCPPLPAACDIESQNRGWKYLLVSLSLITLLMFLARMVFFRLHESPRYLVHAGRHHEAVEALQMISKFNGSELALRLEDVRDHHEHHHVDVEDVESASAVYTSPTIRGTSIDRSSRSHSPPHTLHTSPSRETLRSPDDTSPPDYSATGEPNVPLDDHSYHVSDIPNESASFVSAVDEDFYKDSIRTQRGRTPSPAPHVERRTPRWEPSQMSSSPSLSKMKAKAYWSIPRWIRHPLWAWADRVAMVLSQDWMRTTLLVWTVWTLMSLAYTMFNVYLPKLLEGRGGMADGGSRSLSDSLWDVVIYAVGGCPGAILGAYLVESSMGRRWSLAASTFITAIFCATFVIAQQPWAVRASTVGISLSATTMWAVLYGWTPEIFGTKVRGTACGIASALSRVGGMIAPMLGGSLLVIDSAFPVFTSMGIFCVAGVCVLLLRENQGARGAHRVLAH